MKKTPVLDRSFERLLPLLVPLFLIALLPLLVGLYWVLGQ